MQRQRGFSFLFFLFGLIFFAAGMAVGAFAFSQVYKWHISRGWDQVPMTIMSADLEVHHDEDSTTYAAVAQYRYEYNGQQYEGERVSFSGGADNIGSFHEDTYERLRGYVNGEPFIGYVNPEKPHKAVLIRDMRWGLFAFMLIFPLAFGGVGFGIMLFCVIGGLAGKPSKRKSRRRPQPQQFNQETTFDDRPLHLQGDWDSNRLECSNQGMMWFALLFAVIWNLISVPILFIVPGEVMDEGNYPALLGLLFPLVGAGLIVWAVRSIVRWRKFGRSVFIMDPFPAHPGGIVRGTLELQSPLNTATGDEMIVSLSCIRKITTGSGKNRSTRKNYLWQDQQSVPLIPGQKRIEFGFKLDEKAQLTDKRNSSDERLWRVDCLAQVPGVDFNANFEVPVVAGQPDEQTMRAAEKLVRQQQRDAIRTDAWKDTGVQTGIDGGYPSYLFAAGRNKGMILALFSFGIIFSGVGGGMIYWGGLWLFGGIFALVGLLILWGALYYSLHSTQFTVRPDRLELTGGMLRKKTREYPAFSIKSIDLKTGSQVNSQQFWSIVMTTAPSASAGYGGYKKAKGKSITLASDIRSRRAAQALADRIKEQLGLKDK